MLFLSLEQRIDMGEILKYSQTQVTFSVANVDGSKKKKKKKLLEELESRVACVNSASIDVMVIDVMFFLHLLVDLPSAFVAFVASVAQFVSASRWFG